MRPPTLLALTPGDLGSAKAPRFFAALRSALEAGLRGVLIREPLLEDGAWLQLAQGVRALADEIDSQAGTSQVWLGVHDRVHLARAVRADGVHLGFRSLEPAVVRERFGDEFTIGLSTHADDDRSTWAAADYLFHGPVFAVSSKPEGTPGWRAPIGLDGLAAMVRETERPVWALGGIGPEAPRGVLDSGAAGVAVLSGILPTPTPASAVTAYLTACQVQR